MHSFHFRFTAGILLVLFAIATRLLPHPANFTAISAVTLAAGSYLGWRAAAGITVVAMFASDAVLGFYAWPIMASVYGSLLITAAAGQWVRPLNALRWARVGWSSLGASVLFFVTTNFAVWQYTTLYPKTFAGLVSCYVAAMPFFRNSLVGDLCYVGLLFGSFEALAAWRSSRQKQRAMRRAAEVVPVTITNG